MTKFPLETKVGDLFWIDNEPVKITAWDYTHEDGTDRYFDLEFIDVIKEGRPAAGMMLIPMGFDFYGSKIRSMSSLERELF